MVLIKSSPIFSLSFLMCTSIVLPPTMTSCPQTDFKMNSLLKTLLGVPAKSDNNSNSLRGKIIFNPFFSTKYSSLLMVILSNFRILVSSFSFYFKRRNNAFTLLINILGLTGLVI